MLRGALAPSNAWGSWGREEAGYLAPKTARSRPAPVSQVQRELARGALFENTCARVRGPPPPPVAARLLCVRPARRRPGVSWLGHGPGHCERSRAGPLHAQASPRAVTVRTCISASAAKASAAARASSAERCTSAGARGGWGPPRALLAGASAHKILQSLGSSGDRGWRAARAPFASALKHAPMPVRTVEGVGGVTRSLKGGTGSVPTRDPTRTRDGLAQNGESP